MVNVTKENFLEASKDFISHLPNATFITIDEEMTGIFLPRTKRPPKDDTPAKRYERLKEVPERYSIIQVGVTLFEENPRFETKKENDNGENGTMEQRDNNGNTSREEKAQDGDDAPEFLVRPYNFYIFPAANTRDVTLNSASVSFLNEHGMDLGLWTKQGIPYCARDKAEYLNDKFKAKYSSKPAQSVQSEENKKKVTLTRPDDISFVARAMAKLREWMDRPMVNDSANASHHCSNNDHYGQSSYMLPPCNSYLRRALYETIESEYPCLVMERSQTNPNQIVVYRLSPEEKKAREQTKKIRDWEKMHNEQLGFYVIFKLLSAANRGELFDKQKENEFEIGSNTTNGHKLHGSKRQKTPSGTEAPRTRRIPIIVHNGMLDILFLLTHFHAQSLPDTWVETKRLIRQYFPVLYDTKILATECCTDAFDGTALGDLYSAVYRGGVEKYEAGQQAHDAAYDAYMTGCLFYALSRRILDQSIRSGSFRDAPQGPMSLRKLLMMEDDGDDTQTSLLGRNKLYLMQTMYTIDLSSPLSDPFSRGIHPSTTFRVSDIDCVVNNRDIVRALVNVDSDHGYEIIWVDDTTFMVSAGSQKNEDEETISQRMRIAETIYAALRRRFPRQEIVTLEYYLSQNGLTENVDEKQAFAGSSKWSLSRFFSDVVAKLGINPKKRKLEN